MHISVSSSFPTNYSAAYRGPTKVDESLAWKLCRVIPTSYEIARRRGENLRAWKFKVQSQSYGKTTVGFAETRKIPVAGTRKAAAW
jgi:hypothetical protein